MNKIEKLRIKKERTLAVWNSQFNENNGTTSPLERRLSREAYSAYHDYKTALKEQDD